MQITTLYKYDRGDGKTTVSPVRPDYTELYRLAADEGSAITNGDTICTCIDVDDVSNWRDATEEELRCYEKNMQIDME